MVGLLIGDHHRDAFESQGHPAARPRERADQAGEVRAGFQLGPRRDDVEHSRDPARLTGMSEVDSGLLESQVAGDQRDEFVEVELEACANQTRGACGHHAVDPRPSELERHRFAVLRRIQACDCGPVNAATPVTGGSVRLATIPVASPGANELDLE